MTIPNGRAKDFNAPVRNNDVIKYVKKFIKIKTNQLTFKSIFSVQPLKAQTDMFEPTHALAFYTGPECQHVRMKGHICDNELVVT